MKKKSIFKHLVLVSICSSFFVACDPDEQIDPPEVFQEVNTPATYEFTRNGMSTVSYSGQVERMNQLSEMKSYIVSATANTTKIDAGTLNDMFANTNGDGNGHFSFSSSKQLSNKTFNLDRQEFIDLFSRAAIASDSAIANITAANGKKGFLLRNNGSKILVDENGHEFAQELEKGLMGAIFYHQIVNTYLTDDKIGDAVDNTNLVDGKNYTTMEHHFDEAFGYFGAPVDFESNYSGTGTPRFWADYSNDFDNLLGLNNHLMNAFKRGRQSIVDKQYHVKSNDVETINNQFEVLIASAAIHYINSSLAQTQHGDRMHSLTEGYYFLKALRYSNINYRKITQQELQNMLDNDWGTNFWNVSPSGLNKIKDKLSSTYNLDTVKDQL